MAIKEIANRLMTLLTSYVVNNMPAISEPMGMEMLINDSTIVLTLPIKDSDGNTWNSVVYMTLIMPTNTYVMTMNSNVKRMLTFDTINMTNHDNPASKNRSISRYHHIDHCGHFMYNESDRSGQNDLGCERFEATTA